MLLSLPHWAFKLSLFFSFLIEPLMWLAVKFKMASFREPPCYFAPVTTCLYQSALSLSPSLWEAARTWSGKLTGVNCVSTQHYLGRQGATGADSISSRDAGIWPSQGNEACGKLRLAIFPYQKIHTFVVTHDIFSFFVLKIILVRVSCVFFLLQ